MPVITPGERFDSPERRAILAETVSELQPPETTVGGVVDVIPEGSWFQRNLIDYTPFGNNIANDTDNLVFRAMRTQGVVSSFVLDNPIGEFGQASKAVDPAFNAYDVVDEAFFRKYPYLQDAFDADKGRPPVLDIPNEEAFWYWVRRQQQDFEDREVLGNAGLAGFAASIPAIGVDAVAFGAVESLAVGSAAVGVALAGGRNRGTYLAARLMRDGNYGERVQQWLVTGNYSKRFAKLASVGATTNLTHEQMLRLANPDRNVDEQQAALWAFTMGGVFGGAIPVIGAAASKVNANIISRSDTFARQVSDNGIRSLQEAIANDLATPQMRDALALAEESEAYLKQLIESGQPVDSIESVVTRKTKPLIDELSKRNPDARRLEHPMQDAVDRAVRLQEQDDQIDKFLKSGGTNPLVQSYADLLSWVTPGGRVRRSSSYMARRVSRTLFDDTTALRESVDDALEFQAPVPAEALKWNYDNRMANAMLSVDGQLDRVMGVKGAQPITYQMADGTAMRIMPRQYKKFYRAVADHIRRSDQARRIQGVAEPDAPPAVRQAADDIEAYFRFMADEGEYVKLFGEAVASKPGRFTPRRWRRLSIEANQVQFKDKLYAQAKRNREVDYYTGRRLNEENRVVEDGAITFERDGRSTARGLSAEEREAIREFLKKDGTARAEITEADLREAVGDAVMDRYFEEVDLYLRGQVDATYKTLVSPTNAHGVTRAMPSSVQRRLLEVDEAEFSEFLVSDLEQLVSGYHQQLSGRIAARRAIQRDTELIKLLRERGIDIEAKGFDPALVIKAVGDDFSDQISLLERGGHSKLAKKIRDNRDAMVGEDGTSGVLGLKLEEMEGFNRFNVGVSAGYRLAQNLALRAPVLAYLGKVTVSSVTDMASLVFIRGMRRRHFRAMSQALNLFKEMPRAELEALYVANTAASRSSRANKLFDLDDTGGADPFGQGQRSRVMQRVDRVSESMVDLQFKYGAMNRWNGNMKAMAAVIFQHEMIQNAKKLARANRLMRAGTDKDAALKQVELSEPDAALMNRLGIDGRRADRMMSVIAEHGTALNKTRTAPEKRWANQAEFEKYDGYVSPEYAVWGGKDRDLLEVMTTAVNRMVQDIIVEPKMLSRPLMNRRWWGRMFNQMQSFAFAWGNQHAQLAAARPAHEQIFALFMGIGTGAIADAIHNDLSGRRSFAETGREWADNPAGMVYGSVARSALLGWLARPVGFADQQPWGPGRLLGNNQLSGTYSRPIDWFGFLAGPAGSWLKSAADPLWRLAGSGELDERSQRQLFLAMPYRNSLIVEGAIQAMEAAGIEPPDFTRPTQPNNRR